MQLILSYFLTKNDRGYFLTNVVLGTKMFARLEGIQ